LGTDLLHENPEIIQNLFSVVNSFTRLRLASFVDKPAAQLMFELAISGLTVEQNEIHKYARTFIFMFLSFSQNKQDPQLTPVLQNIELVMASCFEKLIDTCLRIAFSETSITLINTVAEVLAELLLFENQVSYRFIACYKILCSAHGQLLGSNNSTLGCISWSFGGGNQQLRGSAKKQLECRRRSECDCLFFKNNSQLSAVIYM
jgi:hypothetical protein